MNYNVYKQSRDSAWQFLIDNNISSLPVCFGEICRKNNILLLRDVNSSYFESSERGITYIRNGKYNIIVNGKDSLQIQRYTIGHELGHIYMKHPMTDGFYGRSFGMHYHPQCYVEYQAERFSMDILAPACVIWGLNIHKSEHIAKICNIAIQDASYRALRMRELYRRNKFLTSSLEKKVYGQFEEYIRHFSISNVE